MKTIATLGDYFGEKNIELLMDSWVEWIKTHKSWRGVCMPCFRCPIANGKDVYVCVVTEMTEARKAVLLTYILSDESPTQSLEQFGDDVVDFYGKMTGDIFMPLN